MAGSAIVSTRSGTPRALTAQMSSPTSGAGLFVLHRGDSGRLGWPTRTIVAGFLLFALVMSLLPWLVEQGVSPLSRLFARYNPIFAGTLLGRIAVIAVAAHIPPSRWACAPSLVVILALGFAQVSADLAATSRWRAYCVPAGPHRPRSLSDGCSSGRRPSGQ